MARGPIGACPATGGRLVLKPSEKTPLSTSFSGRSWPRTFPTASSSWRRAVRHWGAPSSGPDVRTVLHTGSVATGREVAAECGGRLVKAVMELGGKDPLIVDEGVHPVWAARQAASGAFTNAWQVRTSVERRRPCGRLAEEPAP